MKVIFTHEMIFSFEGPNLCLLGNESDFRKLAESIVEFTDVSQSCTVDLLSLDFIQYEGEEKSIFFSSKKEANKLGFFASESELVFELDPKYWERLFRYFVLMSWYKRTYYLNAIEDCLFDLNLEQDCNFICSSGF
jgi:hypothetical protein